MTSMQKLRQLYIILRWYDGNTLWLAEKFNQTPSDADVRLMHELENEMLDLQRKANSVKKTRKKRK